MTAILEMEMPITCCDCKLSWYESGDDGEVLICVPLLSDSEADLVEGTFLSRRPDCPLRAV
ncbi:hypothetical protein [Candidatus Formimonas warabiya]|uniref:Uncharacterized protein n=1 Tax=Formimonas warabiya TaxID=1761012 RepID=A0A3G1KNT7_FORW1|nr:hypothetical protein [Candidatus Formimonas warabiya]ATW24134.1 hypothetical protein DCMF_04470 [Candidatus Formimonas warabiya]